MDALDANRHRLVEIAENLHRAELNAVERAKLIEEWVELTGEKVAQPAPLSGGRGNKEGVREASRQLGLERTDVQRSMKIASLTPEAQAAARELGLDDNKSALLDAAKKPFLGFSHSQAKSGTKTPPLTTFRNLSRNGIYVNFTFTTLALFSLFDCYFKLI